MLIKEYMSTRKSLLSVKTWYKRFCKHFPYDLSKKGWVFAFDPLLHAERKVVALESLESDYLFWIFFLFSINFFYNEHLTLSWQRPLSYRNESIDLQSKSMDWFLCDNGLRHERVKWSSEKKMIQKTNIKNSNNAKLVIYIQI